MPTRFERIGLRGRLMTIGVLGVAGALILGGVILYAVLASSLTRTVQSTALASAQEVALLVSSGRIPDPVPASGAQVVQVLSADNRVLTGSLTADRLTALVTPEEKARALAGDVVVVAGNRSGLSGGLQVSAVEAGSGADRVTVVAALPTADLESATRTLEEPPARRLPPAAAGLRPHRVAGHRRSAEAGRGAAQRSGEHRRVVHGRTAARSADPRRDRSAGNDIERDARPRRRGTPDPASVRRRRRPRAAQPARDDADPARGRDATR